MRSIKPSYLTLSEAAGWISEELEKACTPRDVLALGELQRLHICAPAKHDLNFEPFDYDLLDAIGISAKSIGFVSAGTMLFLSAKNISDLLAKGSTEIHTLVRSFSENINHQRVIYLREIGVLKFGCSPSLSVIDECRLASGNVELYILKEKNYLAFANNQVENMATEHTNTVRGRPTSPR